MARVFVTGSAGGLGKMAAEHMVAAGHKVVLHARNEQRAANARSSIPGAEAVVIGDLSSIDATREVASQVNRLGTFDAVIHNAAIGYRERQRKSTVDGLPNVFAINSLAPTPGRGLSHLHTPPGRLPRGQKKPLRLPPLAGPARLCGVSFPA